MLYNIVIVQQKTTKTTKLEEKNEIRHNDAHSWALVYEKNL